ncbi:hypothetical protein LEP1GSC047_2083 [Leptospira inadai serovar Lyme str. 10]|uniref:Uncharacterized protein n=1 Tax=Leptospira inadai serovar Lyme str. 10 TaxID=1049790 RepID=V6HEF4_9LEPT|nr:hypothetical protein LEP1GSC047_2083 [Leptospira inadai serovar Lyme str. 10]
MQGGTLPAPHNKAAASCPRQLTFWVNRRNKRSEKISVFLIKRLLTYVLIVIQTNKKHYLQPFF